MAKKGALNLKQKTFCEEYLVDLNGTQAAIRAGYSKNSAHSIADELLRKPAIQDIIQESKAERSARTGITAENVIRELAKIGFANMENYFTLGPDGDPILDFSRLDSDQKAALIEVTVESFMVGKGEAARECKKVKFKLADKRAALVDLGKHLGIFQEDNKQRKPDALTLNQYNLVTDIPSDQLVKVIVAGMQK
jgi:phage terminase small subunit